MSAVQKPDVSNEPGSAPFDALVVGAGFAGIYMLHRLRTLGLRVQLLEAAADVGGVWFWNRYPGARCDVESLQYSYSFSEELQQQWVWTERYATQPEILRYINHVADRFALRSHMRFKTRVVSAVFDEAACRWKVTTAAGDTLSAHYCVMATGCLSAAKIPDIAGYGSFAGQTYHTSDWPHEGVDLTGQRVAVVGTGSSGVQAIPLIAEQAAQLTVFQRTANYSIPAGNAPITPEHQKWWKSRYSEHRQTARYLPSGTIYEFGQQSALAVSEAERWREYESRWQKGGTGFTRAFNDIARVKEANNTAADFVRAKIRAIVKDPVTREALVPPDFPLGAKRICVDTGYFETFNRPHVRLVDVRKDPISRIVPSGIRTAAADLAFDCIVFATGFDAMTGALLRIAITGKDGATLQHKWAAGPRTYLGLMTAGFPNLFMVTGPGSPSVLGNVIVSIEQHVEWIADCVAAMRERGADTIDADREAEERWVEHVNAAAAKTLFFEANSWYLGANVPGKPRIFMPFAGGVGNYRKKCEEVAANGYEGFVFASASGAPRAHAALASHQDA